jgi:hypothetical protein
MAMNVVFISIFQQEMEEDVAGSCPLNVRETGVTTVPYKTARHCLMRKWQ